MVYSKFHIMVYCHMVNVILMAHKILRIVYIENYSTFVLGMCVVVHTLGINVVHRHMESFCVNSCSSLNLFVE